MNNFLLLLIFTVIVSCSSQDNEKINKLKTAIASETREPDNVKFKDIRKGLHNIGYCGEMNAKNKFGGYIGFIKFASIESEDGTWSTIYAGNIGDEGIKLSCNEEYVNNL